MLQVLDKYFYIDNGVSYGDSIHFPLIYINVIKIKGDSPSWMQLFYIV